MKLQPLRIDLTSNSEEYREALVSKMARFRMSATEALRDEGKMLGQRLISFTPPRTASQGKKRVEKDIKKLFYGVRDMAEFEMFEEGKRLNIVETVGGEAAVRLFATKAGRVYGVDRKLYRPDATISEMSEFHQAHRDKRGRVGEAGQKTRDIGRWRFIDVMAVPADRLDEYIRLVRDRVGRAKGGWASGVLALGGRVAQWIGIHARTAGTFDDDTKAEDPSFTFVNESEWAGGGDVGRVMSNAIQARIRDIQARVARAAHESFA